MQVYTVTQLADQIRTSIERDPELRDVWVTGEVSSVFTSAAGHIYFTFKDAASAVPAVLFSGNAGAEHLANGAQVNAHGRVSFYAVRGLTQLYVDTVMPAGLGELAAEFERLRAKLESEGLFDVSRKRALAPFPRRIGVVTSEYGAVIHDIINVLSTRYPIAEVVLCSATVQGVDAPYEIAEGIHALNGMSEMDVIIVGRGGGSMEDLWAFNTEEVARAIYASHAPIVSAVGHESDVTIADFVADLRAPTPSAAAAAVSPDVLALQRELLGLVDSARSSTARLLTRRSQEVETMVNAMQRHLPDFATHRQRVDDVIERGRTALTNLLQYKQEQTNGLVASLSALNPVAVLERGFAVLRKAADGAPVGSVADVTSGDIVR
ncbi:MAG: exodeoxyribonuclease VII large subunit, partial [Dehalococcoidia bacterium]